MYVHMYLCMHVYKLCLLLTGVKYSRVRKEWLVLPQAVAAVAVTVVIAAQKGPLNVVGALTLQLESVLKGETIRYVCTYGYDCGMHCS